MYNYFYVLLDFNSKQTNYIINAANKFLITKQMNI